MSRLARSCSLICFLDQEGVVRLSLPGDSIPPQPASFSCFFAFPLLSLIPQVGMAPAAGGCLVAGWGHPTSGASGACRVPV